MQINNLRILVIKETNFSAYCFDMNANIYGNFQIFISVVWALLPTLNFSYY